MWNRSGLLFLLVWADRDPWQGKLHANFRLSADGEQAALFEAVADDNYLIDPRHCGAQTVDVSYGRYLDGGAKWRGMPSTSGESNRTETRVADREHAFAHRSEQRQNSPNPFNPETAISYQLSATSS